ncbi:MAG: PEP-CTERM sorting domain-containing protein [Betaproteobacteria bacterium]|nr:PEP-CTERM sorting domain-containing protein [Betaproteobacteria bacterium]
MKTRAITKLLAVSVFAFSASASQAADWTIDDVILSWDVDSINYLPGDAKEKPKYTEYFADSTTIVWGYGVQRVKSKVPDYTIFNRSSTYSQSALEITNGKVKTDPVTGNVKTSTLTFYNNYLNDDFYYPENMTMDALFSVVSSDGVIASISDSFDLYHQKAKATKEWRKSANDFLWDIEPGGGFVYIDALKFDADGLGVSFQDGLEVYYYLTDKNGNKLTPVVAGDDIYNKKGDTNYGNACGFSGFETCFVLGGREKLHKGQAYEVNFVITSVSQVPEPETYMMMLIGLGMIGMVARRRRI